MPQPMIVLDHLTKRFAETTVVDDVSLDIDEGTVLTVVGTSGSGKSTLLRLINRLIEPTAGRVLIGGVDTATLAGDDLRRRIGYVIQGYGLFPHRTVAENIATVPRLLKWPRPRIDARVRDLLAAFQLDPAEHASKFPHQLSGGEQQRVGVARALAAEPALLLMDEPFGALDPLIRGKAQDDLRGLQRRFGTTVLLVTHDMEEAFRLGDRVAVMDRARVLQCAPPATLLTRPADAFVERLIGGADRPFRLLDLVSVETALEPGSAEGPPLAAGASLRDALSALAWSGRPAMAVTNAEGRVLGKVSLGGILAHARGTTGDEAVPLAQAEAARGAR
ncbi:amino acid ABC transporter ATP-binding protein [Rhodospirillum rubrum]|uniref:ABC transporter ATP-binding protein n=1 Tax=Rhodospirillum rubrum TaxID=1085 RepID=UPI0019068ABC|nr:ABC transporter ATP-binding protein [Rhodospirillum rubrum]MBK1663813.1 amino acid ABC transporter ATP-binding protein [Rhodospirillum rubrum]MBK1675848.1 amino acid ABC transporter ATP-binding protein [Rhodospirillum rubrum]